MLAFNQLFYDLKSFEFDFRDFFKKFPKIFRETRVNKFRFVNDCEALQFLAMSHFFENYEKQSIGENFNLKIFINLLEKLPFYEKRGMKIGKFFLNNAEKSKTIFLQEIDNESLSFIFHLIFESVQTNEEGIKFKNLFTLQNSKNEFVFDFPFYFKEYFKYLVSPENPQIISNFLNIDVKFSTKILDFQKNVNETFDSKFSAKLFELINWNVEAKNFKLDKILLHRSSAGRTFLFNLPAELFDESNFEKIPVDILKKMFEVRDESGRNLLFSSRIKKSFGIH